MTNVTETFETITRMLRTAGGDVSEIPEEEENTERNEKRKAKGKDKKKRRHRCALL